MEFLRLDRLLSAAADPEVLRCAVGIGFGLITLTLLVLMRTRWGQAHPLRKCVILSVMAHLLFAGYTTTVHIVATNARVALSQQIKISDVEGEGESPGGKPAEYKTGRPWEEFTTEPDSDPELVALERPPVVVPLEAAERQAAPRAELTTRPGIPAAAPVETPLPGPAKLSTAEASRPSDAITSAEPIEAPQATRREASDAPGPGQLGPARSEVQGPPHEAGPASEPGQAGVPGSLLGLPDLPPQVVEGPAVPAPENPVLDAAADQARPTSPAHLATASPESSASGSEGSRTASSERPAGSSAASAAIGDIVGRGSAAGEPAAAAVQSPADSSPSLLAVRRHAEGDSEIPEIYSSRVAPDRPAIARVHGGTAETEGAVQAALTWLAANQEDDGRWNAQRFGAGHGPVHRAGSGDTATAGMTAKQIQAFQRAGSDADTGVTGLALLAFLGAGNTHLEGPYRESVERGLNYLLSIQGADGNLGGGASLYAFMYCHGMAACALSEALGMTGDQQLAEPVRNAVGYTLSAQQPSTGGWRYKAGDPQGDTSQLGWQLMSLKSAELAGIAMPARARQGMLKFLKSVASGTHGGLASYRPNEKVSRTMTAEALVCRQFLGVGRSDPASDEAGDYVVQELPGAGRTNLYYWYYGTLATYHLQGRHWERWNTALKQTLVNSQRLDGDEAGSWDPDAVWGGHGGRVFSTALAALCLEVYYRYLPLYAGREALESRR